MLLTFILRAKKLRITLNLLCNLRLHKNLHKVHILTMAQFGFNLLRVIF